MMPGAYCSCGALIFGEAPEVHRFIAEHGAEHGTEHRHHLRAILPDHAPWWATVSDAKDLLIAVLHIVGQEP